MTARKPIDHLMHRLDKWKIPLVFVAACAAAIAAFGNIRQATYETVMEPCVEKTVGSMMAPVIIELKEMNRNIRYQIAFQAVSIPADTLKKYNEIVGNILKGQQ
jgi:ADP-dependent phosphofructokinase/glucokinase